MVDMTPEEAKQIMDRLESEKKALQDQINLARQTSEQQIKEREEAIISLKTALENEKEKTSRFRILGIPKTDIPPIRDIGKFFGIKDLEYFEMSFGKNPDEWIRTIRMKKGTKEEVIQQAMGDANITPDRKSIIDTYEKLVSIYNGLDSSNLDTNKLNELIALKQEYIDALRQDALVHKYFEDLHNCQAYADAAMCHYVMKKYDQSNVIEDTEKKEEKIDEVAEIKKRLEQLESKPAVVVQQTVVPEQTDTEEEIVDEQKPSKRGGKK